MSAVAYALALFPDAEQAVVHQLVGVIGQFRGMPADAAGSYRTLIRDHLDELGDRLAAAVRALALAARDPGVLEAEMDAAAVPAADAGDPAAAFRATLNAGLADVDPGVDAQVRRIILRAAATPAGAAGSTRAGRWAALRTGRPAAPPALVVRVRELKAKRKTHKEIVKLVNRPHSR